MFRWPEVNGGDADVPRRRGTRSLFALESDRQTQLDDRRELSRPDHSSVTAEVDGFAVGRVEGLVPARVPPGVYPHGVMPWLELRFERLVVFERAYALAVDEHLERTGRAGVQCRSLHVSA